MRNEQKSNKSKEIIFSIMELGWWVGLYLLIIGWILLLAILVIDGYTGIEKIIYEATFYSIALICLMFICTKMIEVTKTLDGWLKNEEIRRLLEKSIFYDFFTFDILFGLSPNLDTGSFDLLMQLIEKDNKKLRHRQFYISVLKKYYRIK